jgi:hypothetical protein
MNELIYEYNTAYKQKKDKNHMIISIDAHLLQNPLFFYGKSP